jgi:hypothetical protein
MSTSREPASPATSRSDAAAAAAAAPASPRAAAGRASGTCAQPWCSAPGACRGCWRLAPAAAGGAACCRCTLRACTTPSSSMSDPRVWPGSSPLLWGGAGRLAVVGGGWAGMSPRAGLTCSVDAAAWRPSPPFTFALPLGCRRRLAGSMARGITRASDASKVTLPLLLLLLLLGPRRTAHTPGCRWSQRQAAGVWPPCSCRERCMHAGRRGSENWRPQRIAAQQQQRAARHLPLHPLCGRSRTAMRACGPQQAATQKVREIAPVGSLSAWRREQRRAACASNATSPGWRHRRAQGCVFGLRVRPHNMNDADLIVLLPCLWSGTRPAVVGSRLCDRRLTAAVDQTMTQLRLTTAVARVGPA